MEMDRNRERFLITLIDQLLSTEGTEWAREEVSDILRRTTGIPESNAYSLFQKIDRHCIEDVRYKQAKELYGFFPDDAIRKQLEEDFISMEHERSRNNFSNFSLHCYQQIECITNYLFETDWIRNAFGNFSNKPAYVFNRDSYKWRTGATISKAVLFKDTRDVSVMLQDGLPKLGADANRRPYWSAMQKVRLVTYFGVLGAETNSEELKAVMSKYTKVYEARNSNHRPAQYKQHIFQFQVDMLDFYGALSTFIKGIHKNIGLLQDGLQLLPFEGNLAPERR